MAARVGATRSRNRTTHEQPERVTTLATDVTDYTDSTDAFAPPEGHGMPWRAARESVEENRFARFDPRLSSTLSRAAQPAATRPALKRSEYRRVTRVISCRKFQVERALPQRIGEIL